MTKIAITGTVLTLLITISLVIPVAINAETLPVSSPAREKFENKEAKLETRCRLLENRINGRIDAYDANYKGQVNRYNNIKSNTVKAVTRLEELGLNTTKLEDDLKQLDVLLKTWNTYRNQFIKTLEDSKSFVCGESEGAFKSQVEQAATLGKELRKMGEDIKNFVKNSIRADLLEIRSQKKSQ